MRIGAALLVGAVSLAAAAPAAAVQIDVTSVVGIWTSADSGVSGLNTNTVTWGFPVTGSGPSGYVFEGFDSSDFGSLQPDAPEIVGEFTHNNFPIFDNGTLPTMLELVITVQGTLSEGAESTNFTLTDTLEFDHFETPNTANPCAAGGVPLCPDQVGLTQIDADDQMIEFLGSIYGFSVNGFFNTANEVVNEVLTVEGAANTVNIQGIFTAEEIVTSVPVPATLPLMVMALGGAAFLARRRS
ncbi:MAG: THxN family PEP-CTERM protein [Pseudomonadota bacterium]